MPAGGLPVASITISTAGAAISAGASSVTCVVPLRRASASDARRERSRGQPTRAQRVSRARAGARSATPTRCDARRAPRLRQEHRAELAGADQPDAQRLAGLRALEQQAMEVHRPHPAA